MFSLEVVVLLMCICVFSLLLKCSINEVLSHMQYVVGILYIFIMSKSINSTVM